MVRRYDKAEVRSSKVQPNGFLRADAVLARCGVQTYQLGDGTTRRELRLPEEVFKQQAMDSFELAPVTDDHPPVMLTADNAASYQRGAVAHLRRDGDLLCASISITDKPLVAAVVDRRKDQLSNGYDCELDMTPGEHPTYGKYDAIQRNIDGNHVAVVRYARAGPVARVRMDAADGIEHDDAAPVVTPAPAEQPTHEPSTESPRMPTATKIHIDGIDYEDLGQVAQVIARRDAVFAEKLKLAETAAATARADAEKARADAPTAAAAVHELLDTEKARADALDGDLKKAEKARTDAVAPERVRELVKARVAIETRGHQVLGAEAKLDAMGEPEIKKAMLEKLVPGEKFDGKSEDYVQGRLDHALAAFDKANPGLEQARRDAELALANPVRPLGHEDAEALRAKRDEAQRDRAKNFKPKLTAKA